MDIKEKIKKIPSRPGVYIMKSKDEEVLYVGKASSLKSRLSSYFSSSASPKTDILLEKVVDIDYVECENPQQALILEAALIKEKKPKYNITLRDNKSYPYLAITNERFPCVFICRPKGKSKDSVFGPYPSAKTLKAALMSIREIFPYRSCRRMPKTVCLFFHLKLCPAPCIGKINYLEYRANINNISKILKGERKKLLSDLKAEMEKMAKENKFEKAASLRDKLLAIDNLYRGKPKIHQIISLKELLNLPTIPLLIEAIDISSLGGQDSVGSVVVFREGVPDKNNYRRFLIKEAKGRDDYAMISEVVKRRYLRLKQEKKSLPDLIIIDGGKGHLMKVWKVLKISGISVPLISIAKKHEEIWIPFKRRPLVIPKDATGLFLIQKIRDEAHRFAHAYQLIRRRKRILESSK